MTLNLPSTHSTVDAAADRRGTSGGSSPVDTEPAPVRPATTRTPRWLGAFSVKNIGAVYVLVIICIVFSIWVPDTFPAIATVKQVLDSNAVTGIAALAIVVPLSARTFDLSFAYTMSLAGVTTAHFVVATNIGLTLSILAGLGAALAVGVINAFVVVVMKIDSFIGTLATGSLVQAFITFVTNDSSINDPKLSGSFSSFGQDDINGITYPVFYLIGLAVILWLFLEHTATGRRLYAVGFNLEAARLANIRVNRLRFCSLLVSGFIAGLGGIILASTISAGSPTAGTPYLLPAFASVFVGATQLKNGRFNAWGTLIAVIMLGTGVVGLGLANAPTWAADMFTGVVLLAALASTGVQRRMLRRGGRAWLRRRTTAA